MIQGPKASRKWPKGVDCTYLAGPRRTLVRGCFCKLVVLLEGVRVPLQEFQVPFGLT